MRPVALAAAAAAAALAYAIWRRLSRDAARGDDASRTARWAAEQDALARKLRAGDDAAVAELAASLAAQDGRAWRVAGLDISTAADGRAVASAVVVELPSRRKVAARHEAVVLDAPYVPGYLGFREAPALARVLANLVSERPEAAPTLALIDGNGVLHPRGVGSACHVGVLAGVPTVGVAKALHHVDGLDEKTTRAACRERPIALGEWLPLVGASGRTWGAALRATSDKSFRPVYVSVGHGVSLESAVAVVNACCKHRVPEPVRLADLEGREVLRRLADVR